MLHGNKKKSYFHHPKLRLMKTTIRLSALLAILSVFFFSCQKESSFELGENKASVGSLQINGTGGCLGATVGGSYKKDSTLNGDNYADIKVQVDSAGSYIIKTDTVNGYTFRATGIFTTTGVTTVRLAGSGKPLGTGTNIFTITYNGTVCEFSVTVTMATGGTSVFTVNCSSATVNGTYDVGDALSTANTAVVSVNVTKTGTWAISTPATNGIVFSGSGTFTATGSQSITLTASGTPATTGTFNIPVTIGGNTCTFPVTYSLGSGDYFPRTTYSNWSYQYDGNVNDSLLIKVTNITQLANGNTFYVFAYTNNIANGFDTSGYYRKSGHDYFEWIDIGTYIRFDNPLWVDYIFLKDNLSTGDTWYTRTFTGTVTPMGGSPVSVSARFFYTILQQNVTVNVNSVSYANTIEVKQELQQMVSGNWQTIASAGYLRNYYAKDKGLIKQDYYLSTGALSKSMEARRLVIY